MASGEAHNGEDATTKKAGQSQDQTPQRDSFSANAQVRRDAFVVFLVVEKVISCHACFVARTIEDARDWS